jgi:hypothetical protein
MTLAVMSGIRGQSGVPIGESPATRKSSARPSPEAAFPWVLEPVPVWQRALKNGCFIFLSDISKIIPLL